MPAKRAKRIHETDEVSTLDLSNDFFVLDRLSAGVWDNRRISGTNLKTEMAGATLGGEDTYKDHLAIEFFEDYSIGSISAFDKGYGWNGNGVGSGCSIVSRTPFGNGNLTQRRLSISSGQYGRKFAWGDSWNRIQIAILWRINHTATFDNSAFYFGLCSGTSNMAGSALCDNFIGMRGPNNGVGDVTFTNGTRMDFFDINPNTRFVTRRGAGPDSDQGSGAGSNGRHVAATEGWLSLFLIEYSRPTFATDGIPVTYNLGRQTSNATQVEMSLGKGNLLDLFGDTITGSMAGGPLITQVGSGGLAGVTASFAFDQSTGKLDAFNFVWDKAFGCEIAALGARKLF